MKKTTTKKTSSVKSAPAASKAAAPVAVKAPAKKGVAPARKKATAPEAPATFISARVDIGFGNHLYLRGEGPGLSWDHGIAMDCIAADGWAHTIKGATAPVVFKVLINDEKWCTGIDYTVEPGQSVTVTPTF
jgi:hypothetical protein